MSDMSRAIRGVLETRGVTIKDIPDEDLKEFASILNAFWLDLRGELRRREEEQA